MTQSKSCKVSALPQASRVQHSSISLKMGYCSLMRWAGSWHRLSNSVASPNRAALKQLDWTQWQLLVWQLVLWAANSANNVFKTGQPLRADLALLYSL